MAFFVLSLTALASFSLRAPAHASPSLNRLLNYQVRLTDAAGVPVADGTKNVKISFYDAASGGTRIATDCGTVGTPVARKVVFANGTGTVLIGDVGADASHNCSDASAPNAIASTLFNADLVYLGITVEADAEMTPRKRIVATAYSLNADRLDDLETSAAGGVNAFVPVTDASGNFTLSANATFDTNTLFVDSANNRIGVGTITPTGAALHVNAGSTAGDLTALRISHAGSAVNDNVAVEFMPASGTVTVPAKIVGVATGFNDVDLAVTVVNFGTATELVRFDGDGAVGIGDTTPDFLLDVAGTLGVDGNLTLGDAATDTLALNAELVTSVLPDVDDTYDLGSNVQRWRDLYLGPATLHIGTATLDEGALTYNTTTNALAIDSTGAVEINGGSGSTGCSVDASGNFACSGTVTGGGGGGGFSNGGNSFAAAAILGTNDTNSLSFETNNITYFTIASGGGFTLPVDTDWTLTGGVNGLSFDGTTFSVDATNNRIGIGTAAPGHMLHVVGGSLANTVEALYVSGTINGAAGNEGARFDFTSSGTGAISQVGTTIIMGAGYTGTQTAVGLQTAIATAGTGNDLKFDVSNANPLANSGFNSFSTATTTGLNIGGYAEALGGNTSIGLVGKAIANKASATNIGVIGVGRNIAATPIQVGGYFGLHNSTPTFTSSALIADNADQTSPIFLARDNGSTVFTIADGGNVGVGDTSPESLFSVDGSAFIDGSAVHGGTGSAILTVDGNSGTDVVEFRDFSAVSLFVIESDGKVGISDNTPTALLTVGSGDKFKVNADGDVTSSFTSLNGSSTANGAGANSTTLVLAASGGTNFDVGNYVQVASAACVTNPCYAKITAKSTDTLTISPALSWSNADAVTEVHVPEIGGVDLTQALTNRYGRGYFIDGVVTGNGSTYFTDNKIESGGAFTINAVSGQAVTFGGSLTVTGAITSSATGNSVFNGPLRLANVADPDPTGTNGLMYYNTTNNKFRCFQAGAWTDCIGAGGGGMSIGGAVTSGTAGSLLFVGTGPVLAQDNANLFWDDTSNRLGIGDVSPTNSLDVTGAIGISDTAVIDSSRRFFAANGAVGSSTLAYSFSADPDTGLYSTGSNVLGMVTGGAEAARFTIDGSSNSQLMMGTTTALGGITVDSNDAGGIAGIAAYGHVTAGTDFSGGQFAGVRSRGTRSAPTGVAAGDTLANYLGVGRTNASGFNYGAMIAIRAAETFTATASGADIAFLTTSIGANGGTTLDNSERMVLTSAGSLGIGDPSPLATLTVGSGDLFQVAGASGNVTTSGDMALNGGDLTTTSTTFNLVNSTATTVNFAGAATTLNLGPSGAGAASITLGGGSADTGCTVANATGNLTCTGNITGAATGTTGYWTRTGTTLNPATAGDNIATGGSGAITSSGLLTASNGLTLSSGALNLTAGAVNLSGTSGSISLTGFGTTSITSTAATGNIFALADNALTLGVLHDLSSTSTTLSGGVLLRLTKTGTSGSTAFTGAIQAINYSQTFDGGVALNSTGRVFQATRTITLNNSGQTHTISGALASFSDNSGVVAGTLASTADVVQIGQNYVENTGAALNVTTATLFAGLAMRVNDDGTFTDSTPFVIDNAGNVGVGDASPSALLTVGSGDKFKVNADGDVTSGFTTLDGSTLANGSGAAATTLVVDSTTNFNAGNYVLVNSTYAKIVSVDSGTNLTISPALTWADNAPVTEQHVPEIGGTDLTSTLANRYGRGYFIDGIVAGNGSTYITDNKIVSGGTLAINPGGQSVTFGGSLTVTGAITSNSTSDAVFNGPLKLANMSSDPSGTNGLTFYNTTSNKFRCYQGGAWTDCISSSGGTLQAAYNGSTTPELTLDATRGGLTIRDASSPIGTNLLEIQNNAGGTTYLGVTTSALNLGVDLLPSTAPTTGSASRTTTIIEAGQLAAVPYDIVVASDTFPVISYYDSTGGDLKVAKCANTSCSTGTTFTTVDSTGVVGSGSSIALSSDGFPVISYYDSTNGDLKVAKCGNASCSSGNTITTVDSTGTVGSPSSIVVDAGDGFPVISYYDSTNGDLKVAKCGNASCSSGNTITTVDSTNNVGNHNSITLPSGGTPVISYYDATGLDLKVLKCGNASCSSGNTATTVDSTGNVGTDTSIAISADTFPIISYRDPVFWSLKAFKCGNASCTSGNNIHTFPGPAGFASAGTSIAVPADGFPVVVYQYDDGVGFVSSQIIKCSNATCTTQSSDLYFGGGTGSIATVAISSDGFPVLSAYDTAGNGAFIVSKCSAAGCASYTATTLIAYSDPYGDHMDAVTPADGLPIVSYYDSANGDLKVAKCGNASCSSGNTTSAVDSSANVVGSYTSIAVGSDGFPVISYLDSTSQDLKVAKCGNASCSSGNTITTVDSTNSVGAFGAIAVPADGMPVISYYDSTTQDLKVLKCGNASCSSGNTATTVDSTGVVGQYTSIAISSDGFPIISYYDVTNLNLKVLKCGNAACTSGNNIAAPDLVGDVGQFSQIAVPVDGLPIVSYYDTTNSDLKVLKCGNATCTSGNAATAVDTAGAFATNISLFMPASGTPIMSYRISSTSDIRVAKCGNYSCSSGTLLTTIDAAGVDTYSAITAPASGFPVVFYHDTATSSPAIKAIACVDSACESAVSTSYSGGKSIGSTSSYFTNVYAATFWGKNYRIENFDLAETYRVRDTSIAAGDIVRVATAMSGDPAVEKTSRAYDAAMGVISTQPGLLLTQWDAADDNRPVALKGRVPVKVNNEGGAIHAGDAIAPSSVPGVGMRASKPGRIVGYALDDWEGTSGTVELFVNPGFHDGEAIVADESGLAIRADVAMTPVAEASAEAASHSLSLSFRGSAWDASGSIAVTRAISARNAVTDKDAYRLSFANDAGDEIAYLGQDGDVAIKGRLFPSDRGALQTEKYIFYDGSAGPGGDRMRTNANGWGADGQGFAEMFPSDDALEEGEIAMIDTRNPSKMRRAIGGREDAPAYLLAGIVTAESGYLAGMDEVGSYPIALEGRARARVVGPVKIGDAITISLTNGVGVVATTPTYVVGYALEAKDDAGPGAVLVFVKTGWWNGSGIESGNGGTSGADAGGLTVTENTIDFSGRVLLQVGAMEGYGGEWRIDAGGFLVAKEVSADKVAAKQFAVRKTDAMQTVGKGTVVAGSFAAVISNAAITERSQIIVTFRTDPGNRWWIDEVHDGSFILKLAMPAVTDVAFTYLIVDVIDETTPVDEVPAAVEEVPAVTPEPLIEPPVATEEAPADVATPEETTPPASESSVESVEPPAETAPPATVESSSTGSGTETTETP